jgi:uncharacterized membrane protein YeaQ/YmgE (transglycosylase-associated protein family)
MRASESGLAVSFRSPRFGPFDQDENSKYQGALMSGFIWWIVVGLIAGFVTGKLMRGEGFGFFADIIVGIVGAVAGGFLMTKLGYAAEGGMLYTICVAVIGAVILTFLVRLIKRA